MNADSTQIQSTRPSPRSINQSINHVSTNQPLKTQETYNAPLLLSIETSATRPTCYFIFNCCSSPSTTAALLPDRSSTPFRRPRPGACRQKRDIVLKSFPRHDRTSRPRREQQRPLRQYRSTWHRTRNGGSSPIWVPRPSARTNREDPDLDPLQILSWMAAGLETRISTRRSRS